MKKQFIFILLALMITISASLVLADQPPYEALILHNKDQELVLKIGMKEDEAKTLFGIDEEGQRSGWYDLDENQTTSGISGMTEYYVELDKSYAFNDVRVKGIKMVFSRRYGLVYFTLKLGITKTNTLQKLVTALSDQYGEAVEDTISSESSTGIFVNGSMVSGRSSRKTVATYTWRDGQRAVRVNAPFKGKNKKQLTGDPVSVVFLSP